MDDNKESKDENVKYAAAIFRVALYTAAFQAQEDRREKRKRLERRRRKWLQT